MRRPLAALLAATALGLAACGDDEDEPSGSTAATSATTATQEPAAAAPAEGCEAVDKPEPKEDGAQERRGERLSASKPATVTLQTNCGDIAIRLDVKRAPETTSSFAGLVKAGFYDGLTFHRIVPGFVIQGGDPLGTGTGGPGYSVEEAPPSSLTYDRGLVAMAKAGNEPAGTSGSQFFIVTGDAGLPPEYALVGRVTSGLDVVDRIAAAQTDPATEQPLEPVVIEDATLKAG